MSNSNKLSFAPMLYIPNGVKDLGFYTKAFGAVELRRWSNDDGTVHVAEFSIGDALFHVHEISRPVFFEPAKWKGTTVSIGLFVPDVAAVMMRAIAAGAKEISPATDYDYGYRQGEIVDPFGHHWTIQMKI